MSELEARFVDSGSAKPYEPNYWPAIVIPRASIEREIERLASLDRPANGRRSAKIVHPYAGPSQGLAPGIDVTLQVLKPGEEATPIRTNSSLVSMCIRGTGIDRIGEKKIAFGQFDVWNTPSMVAHRCRNDGDDLQVRLTYSNAPLLQQLEIYYVEDDPVTLPRPAEAAGGGAPKRRAKDFADDIAIGNEGARLMGYEHLIDPDVVANKPLLFAWPVVSSYLDRVSNLGPNYTGRRLYLLYNPATERRNGTTHSFFATIAKYPPDTVDQPHRHSSAAINYYFGGNGRSTVQGQKFVWEAGDLMLSAPGWAVHNHAARDQGFYALTVQDHPLQIAMDSLIWQETLKSPIVSLGTDIGAQTNIGELTGAK